MGTQQGQVLATTSKGNIIHWSGDRLLRNTSDCFCIVATMGLLPYQAGTALSDIGEVTTTELYTSNSTNNCDHCWEVFHIPDVNEDDDDEADISSDKTTIAGESDAQRATQQRKNRQHAQQCLHAQHHHETWE